MVCVPIDGDSSVVRSQFVAQGCKSKRLDDGSRTRRIGWGTIQGHLQFGQERAALFSGYEYVAPKPESASG